MSCVIQTQKAKGFTLIEVLVAAVVLIIGILGLGTLMMAGLKSDQSSYLRTQASTLAYDIADRIRLNEDGADAGDYNNIDTDAGGVALPACMTTAAGCNSAQISQIDIYEWSLNFQNVAGIANANYVAKLPNGRGQVTRAGDNYVISITWNEKDWNAAGDQIEVTNESLVITMSL